MAAFVNTRNFSQSLFESANSVFVFAMLEKRIDWRGLVSQASEQTLKNRTFSTKTGKSIIREILVYFLGSCHDAIDLSC